VETLGLFALSLLVGTLIGAGTANDAATRQWLQDSLPHIVLGAVVASLFYLMSWVVFHGADVPSAEFRLFAIIKNSIEYLPLMIMAAVVGFAATRWLQSLADPASPHVTHGLGVAGAALLTLGLFLLQDPRLAQLIRAVNTPVFSVEFTRAEETSRPVDLLARVVPSAHSGLLGSVGEPIAQSLGLLEGLGQAIERDLRYVDKFSPNDRDHRILATLERERLFFASVIAPLSGCLIAIRQRVHDATPVVFIERELAHALRAAHRLHVKKGAAEHEKDPTLRRLHIEKSTAALREQMFPFVTQLSNLFKIIALRRAQHEHVDPLFDGPQRDLKDCDKVDMEITGTSVLWQLETGGFSAETPYLTLMTAALLNAFNEKPAAVEEIDFWLENRRQADRKAELQPRRGSMPFMASRVFSLRAEYWAGAFLMHDPKLANVGMHRLHRGVTAADEILRNMSPPEFPAGMRLRDLVSAMDRRSGKTNEKTSICHTMGRDVERLVLSAASMINAIVYFTVVRELGDLSAEFERYVRDYHEVLGFIEPRCLQSWLTDATKQLKASAAFVDTYLVARRAVLRDLPEQRVRHELCMMKAVVDEAGDHAWTLEQLGRAEYDKHNFARGEEELETARGLKKSVRLINEAIKKLGPAAC
jgi:hypothetical protein